MEKEFIPYKQALTLKELGFDEPCCANMFDYSKPHINTDVPNRIRYFMPNYSDNFNKEYDFGVVGHKDLFVSLPTFSQAFRWFREKYRLFGDVGIYGFEIIDLDKKEAIFTSKVDFNKTYEEAELECLNKLIEVVKNKSL